MMSTSDNKHIQDERGFSAPLDCPWERLLRPWEPSPFKAGEVRSKSSEIKDFIHQNAPLSS